MNRIHLCVAFLLLVIRFDSAQATPTKLQDGGKGEQVVRQVVGEVESSLGSTNGFLFKIAWVESKFGTDRNTYRSGNLSIYLYVYGLF